MLNGLAAGSGRGHESRLFLVGMGTRSIARYLVVAAFVLILASTSTIADTPKIDRVTPTGAQVGTTTELTLTGKPGGELKAWSDCKGLTFSFSKKFNRVKAQVPKDVVPGQWWLRVYNAEGASRLFPFFVGALPELSEVEPNNFASSPQKLTGNSVVTGALSKAGDVDVYSIEARKGETLVATMNANRIGSPMDGVLQLLDSRGVVITQNDESYGFDPQIVFKVPADGTYLVRAFAFPAAPNSSIRFGGAANYVYRLKVTTDEVIDHTMPLVTEAGKTPEVGLFGWNLKTKRTSLKTTENPSRTRAVSANGATFGLKTVHHPCFVESKDGESLRPPFTVSGRIVEQGEADIFRVSAKKGSLNFTVAARSLFSPLDPVLRVLDADGKLVKEHDDVSRSDQDVRTSIRLKADGEYTVEVRDRFGHGGPRYAYALTCTPPTPDFLPSVAKDQFSVATGKDIEIDVKVELQSGFAELISFEVEGLPDGVTVEPTKFEPKKGEKSKVVKLKLKSVRDKPYGGPFRIRCLSGTTERVAVGPSIGSLQTVDFWLSATPAAK